MYKARHRIIEETVAIKLMLVAVREDEAAMKRFVREVKLGSRIRHPNIVEFLDADEEDGNPYLVMEYIDGIPLEDRLKQADVYSEIPPELANQLFDAVQAIHNVGMVHRDIKPANIIMTGDGTVKLIDLGLIKNISEDSLSLLTNTGVGIGTPAYLPPEQLYDARSVDSRADIYSLGATFYTMLCGVSPIGGKDRREFFKNIKDFNIIPPHEVNNRVSKKTGKWVMKALEEKPKKRYKNIAEFRKAYNKVK